MPKYRPCRVRRLAALVEDAAQSTPSEDVEVGNGCLAVAGVGEVAVPRP